MAHARHPRKTEGYNGSKHTPKERQWYAALADKVGYKLAPDYADHIINWKQGRPPDNVLKDWLWAYDDEKWTVDENIRARVDNKVDRLHKQEHMTFLRRGMKTGHIILDKADEHGEIQNPVQMKYLYDGVNQGMMLHNVRMPQSEQLMNLGGLTINVGQKPPPRKLRQKQVDQIIEGDFKVLPMESHANSNSGS